MRSAYRIVLLALVAIPFAASDATAQLAKEVQGAWSGDPACSRVAMRHVFAEGTFEWTGDGRRFYYGEARYEVKGGRLMVSLVKDIDRPFQHPDAPRAGDMLTYQRVGDGWRPFSMTRNGKATTTPSDTPVFRRCT
ncbi:MAG: hypothetical protein AB7F36_09650 [Reyranellaceae bacterium]